MSIWILQNFPVKFAIFVSGVDLHVLVIPLSVNFIQCYVLMCEFIFYQLNTSQFNGNAVNK